MNTALVIIACCFSFFAGIFATVLFIKDNIPELVKEAIDQALEELRKDGIL